MLDSSKLQTMIRHAGEVLQQKSGYFSEIDSRFGDGDHGVTMNKIGALLAGSQVENGDLHAYLDNLGDAVMAVGGGSAGPLYGTLIGGLAGPLEGKPQVDGALLKAMLEACREAMYGITTARVGDKTMMDALIPAVDAALDAPDDVGEILAAAAAAAREGAKASEGFVSKFGRAKSYKEQTIGTPDAGAESTACLFQGLLEAL